MGTSAAEAVARATKVRLTRDELVVTLRDGRVISVPLAWYPRLLHATAPQRDRWRLIGDGIGIHWPSVDEDLSVAGLLRGVLAPQSEARHQGAKKRRQRTHARTPARKGGRSRGARR